MMQIRGDGFIKHFTAKQEIANIENAKRIPQLAVQWEIYEEREGPHTYSDDVQDAEQTVNTVSR